MSHKNVIIISVLMEILFAGFRQNGALQKVNLWKLVEQQKPRILLLKRYRSRLIFRASTRFAAHLRVKSTYLVLAERGLRNLHCRHSGRCGNNFGVC
jgi:hypothetical protein